jgi:broad specificity phosphatase PhoE
MNSPSLRLYLVRHGETEWSQSSKHTSFTDIPLTEQGEEDAHMLGEQLRSTNFARVFSSPMQRAQRTCALARIKPAAEIEPDLAEWNYGDYEGQHTLDIYRARPNWNLFRDGCPGGEIPDQVSERADRLLVRLRELDGNIALFSHGHFGCVLATRWIGLPVIDGQHFLLGTTSLSLLEYEPNHPEVPVIALWNVAPHEKLDVVLGSHHANQRTMKQRAIDRWENEGGEIPGEQPDKAVPANGGWMSRPAFG